MRILPDQDFQRQDSNSLAIQLKQVHKVFPIKGEMLTALAGVDLVARRGEFVTIVGPSGCGKSTLLRIICGLEVPNGGQVLIEGRNVNRRSGLVGYMPQEDLLFPWRSVLNNVILGPELGRRDKESSRREALLLFPRFGLAGFESSYPFALSGGMKQRAALLRTILCHKEIMLLDEPLGALDALTRWNMQEWLLAIWEEFKKTVLFVTHDVDEAIFLADRVYVMTARPGRIKLEVSITLPRPRHYGVRTSFSFASLKEQIVNALVEESQRTVANH